MIKIMFVDYLYGYLIAGFMKVPWIAILIETVILIGVIMILSRENIKEVTNGN